VARQLSSLKRFAGVMVIPFGVTAHFAASSGVSFAAFHEFQVLRRPSTGELRVATPGVWTRERRRIREDPSAIEVLRLSVGSVLDVAASGAAPRAS
jgi:hypothetical protein